MLKDCLNVFDKIYKDKGIEIILNNYKLSTGTYVLIKKNGDIEVLDVDKTTYNRDDELYRYFVPRDYFSKYLDSNKAINTTVEILDEDGKKEKIGTKVVHSNNCLTFFIKKENLSSGKINKDVIKKYFSTLKEIYGVDDIKVCTFMEKWLCDNLFNFEYSESQSKQYIKFFYEEELEVYKNESNRYIVSKICNDSRYNIELKDKIYGLHNNNMSLNMKKPYLEAKKRKVTTPYLIDQQEMMRQKIFFDYLGSNLSDGKNLYYINDENIYPCRLGKLGNEEFLKKTFSGFCIRVSSGLEPAIYDFDTISKMDFYSEKIQIIKHISVKEEILKDRKLFMDNIKVTKDVLEEYIDNIFFENKLISNYQVDKNNIILMDHILKQILIENIDSIFDWIYKGNQRGIKSKFSKWSMILIKNSIRNGYIIRAKQQYNLRSSILRHIGEKDIMSLEILNIKKSLAYKMDSCNTLSIQSDEEYYYAIGQMASYLISINRYKSSKHAMANYVLSAKTNEKITLEVRKLFRKNLGNINKNNKRVNNLYAMILQYKTNSKVNEELLLLGYLSSNLIFSKKESDFDAIE